MLQVIKCPRAHYSNLANGSSSLGLVDIKVEEDLVPLAETTKYKYTVVMDGSGCSTR